ncbi:MAG TPA: ABC transporter permease subunit [Dehalococcoidales bacterium]|nr:ABC transporter permease subunit [Dehalococcoidales bacterium]
MSKLLHAELFKLRKRGMTWIVLFVTMGIIVIINLLLYAISRIALSNPGSGGMSRMVNILDISASIPFSLSMLSSFGAVMAVILIASTVGNEYNWRTLRIALISGKGRVQLLAAKIISVAVVVIILVAVSLAVGFIMSIITNAWAGNSLDFSFFTASYGWSQFLQFWRTLFIILPFMMMGLLFAVIGRSAMPGIAVGVGILFLEPILTPLMRAAGGWVAEIPSYLFSANVNAINALSNLPRVFRFGGGSQQAPSTIEAYLVLGAYVVVFTAVAFYLFRKRDVTG